MRAAEFVQSYFSAWNHHDPEGVADHLAENGIYRDVPENAQRSHDELVKSLEEFFSRYRHRYELIGEILGNRDMIAFQYRMVPDGKGDPTGAWHGAEFVTLHGNAAMTITDYYDIPGSPERALTPAMSLATRRSKYAKSGLDDARLRALQRRLEAVMQRERAFRQPDLTLPKLADLVGCSPNHLSQVINAGFGVSFFEYLNGYRVQLAKELLSQPERQLDAILDVAFAVGFNSNSAFYTAFRKRAGQTPAEFRKSSQRTEH